MVAKPLNEERKKKCLQKSLCQVPARSVAPGCCCEPHVPAVGHPGAISHEVWVGTDSRRLETGAGSTNRASSCKSPENDNTSTQK